HLNEEERVAVGGEDVMIVDERPTRRVDVGEHRHPRAGERRARGGGREDEDRERAPERHASAAHFRHRPITAEWARSAWNPTSERRRFVSGSKTSSVTSSSPPQL